MEGGVFLRDPLASFVESHRKLCTARSTRVAEYDPGTSCIPVLNAKPLGCYAQKTLQAIICNCTVKKEKKEKVIILSNIYV